MARTVRDAKLETRAARDRLKPREKPHWRTIIPQALHLGYRRRRSSAAGYWVERRYVRRDGPGSPYRVETIGLADDYQDANGETVLSYAQAQQRAIERREALDGPKGALTVRGAVEAYLEFLETNRKSAEDARYRAAALILPQLGDAEVGTLKTETIRAWLNKMVKQAPRLRTRKGKKQQHREMGDDPETLRRRKATANRTLTVLKAALNRAWRDGRVPSDTAWRRVEPFEDVDAARVHYLSVAEAQRLTNAADPDFRALVLAALQTGARYGELAALRVADFNPDTGTVAIRQSKSGKPRHVVLTEEGVEHFGGLCAGRAAGALLTKANGQPWGKSHQVRPMAETVERAKITQAISFHGLRHTYASLAVMNGVPLLVVARNLGHTDTRMVEKHYGHLAPSYVADAIRAGAPRFAQGLGGPRTPGKVAQLRPRSA
jgi:integrase